ncbi:hypothetical protein M2152_002593 [Microbacteriaceae bacterium SG_E_30_P1]|uniref:DNA primase n=1 Tax=Antiquaquibacter oligotrophicus TaxID=2880260 RepID=A0ABT6KRE4_9MICO|nr:hypothetical protein [Antiquaquibacter oligotrophicus]MDH6182411.1 hypothetical protein [Antiquaquibacter oligotrophicus]UDF14617.1 hypothetical protein LH407_07080 [Antiquaquibacter oligotrophicus]
MRRDELDDGALAGIVSGDQGIDDDLAAEEQSAFEADELGIPEEAQPDTQGEDPLEAELGEDGQGDLAPEDL